MAKTLTQLAQENKQAYINACNAVIGRGGSVPSGMPFGDLASAITNIPHDQTLAWQKVNANSQRVVVPANAEKVAQVNKIGGMTYKSEDGAYEGLRHTKTTSIASVGVNKFNPNIPPRSSNTNYITLEVIDNNIWRVTTTRPIAAADTYEYLTSERITILGSTLYFKMKVKLIGKVDKVAAFLYVKDKDGNTLYNFGYETGRQNGIIGGDAITGYEFANSTSLSKYPTASYCYINFYANYGATFTREDENEQNGAEFSNIMVSFDADVPYTPYIELDTLEIPEAVQNNEGYGMGIDETYNNHIGFEKGKYSQKVYEFEMNDQPISRIRSSFISGQSTYRYYISNAQETELIRRIRGDTPCICDRLNKVTYAKDEVGFYLDTTTSIYFKSPYSTVAETQEWLRGVKFILPLLEPIETDISAYLNDGFIEVEGGGTIEFVNEYNHNVPSETTYLINTVGG